jgi:hypothetical protein
MITSREVESIARINARMAVDQNESPDSYRQNAADTVREQGGSDSQWADVQTLFDRFYDEATRQSAE